MTKEAHQKSIYQGILNFQKAQFKVMNKKKNLAKDHWSNDSNDVLFTLLQERVQDLGNYIDNDLLADRCKARQQKLCADIGNYAMMIMDNVRGNK